MSMIEDINRDCEAGTRGPWALVKGAVTEYPFDWYIYCEGSGVLGYYTGGKSHHHDVHSWGHRDEDARRIARVPDLEAALIAAEELAKAYETYASRANADMPEDWAAMDNALVAYRAATGAA